MPEPTGRGSREFLPSANQALSELEEGTGKPVLIMEVPELKVLATIRRAGPEESSHVLRIKGGSNRVADYLIVFQCRIALLDGQEPRAVLRDNFEVREQVISECVELHSQMPVAKARELGSFIYDGLILQLRSMGRAFWSIAGSGSTAPICRRPKNRRSPLKSPTTSGRSSPASAPTIQARSTRPASP